MIIENVHAREILDSRGNPTVEVEVSLKDAVLAPAFSAMVEGVSVATLSSFL